MPFEYVADVLGTTGIPSRSDSDRVLGARYRRALRALADDTVAGAPHMYHGHILRQDDRGLMSR
jgi:hypothetical protein